MVSCSVSASPLSEFVWSLAACFAWKDFDFEIPAFDSWLQDIFDQPNGTADGSAAKRPVGTIMCNLKGDQYQSEAFWVFWAGLCIAEKTCYNLHTISSTQQSHRHLQMLLDFLVEFVKPHFELTERLVAALWRKASGWRVSECTIKSETLTGQTFLKPRCCNEQCRNTMYI